MGIYVYPKTDDPKLLEQLAGVPSGTSEELRKRLVVFKYIRNGVYHSWFPDSKRIEGWGARADEDRGLRLSELLHSHPAAAQLHKMYIEGFGKLSRPAAKLLVEWGFTDATNRKPRLLRGHVDDPMRMAELLQAQAGVRTERTFNEIYVRVAESGPSSRDLPTAPPEHLIPIKSLEGIYWR